MSVDTTQFRSTLAQWASGVTIVTAAHEGLLYGMTASSFSSVSLTPPLILICVGKDAYTHNILLKSGSFGVNILSAEQAALGKKFSERHEGYIDRFSDIPDLQFGDTGAPLLPGVMAWMDCQTYQVIDAGDHTIFIGEVLTSQIYGGEPLLYFSRKWGQFCAK